MIKSQHLIADLSDDKVAFFNEGILCKGELEIPAFNEPLEEYPINITNTSPGLPDSGLYFRDGSGGIRTSSENIRSCGVGVTHVHNNPTLTPQYKMSTRLQGLVQAVSRSEITAVLILVQNIEHNGRNKFFTELDLRIMLTYETNCLEK